MALSCHRQMWRANAGCKLRQCTVRTRPVGRPRMLAVASAAIPTAPAVPQDSSKDLTALLLEKVVSLALRSRLKSHEVVETQVWADTLGIMSGRFRGMQIHGERWLTPVGMSAQILEVAVGELVMDYGALVWQRTVKLVNVPEGRCRIVLTAEDLGNFMLHPVLKQVAATAIQGEMFDFASEDVVVTDETVTIHGKWRGEEYICLMRPLPEDANGRQLEMSAKHISGQQRKESEVVAVEIGRFFSSMEINLQGVELGGPTLKLIPATEKMPSLLEITMDLHIRSFPPLNLAF